MKLQSKWKALIYGIMDNLISTVLRYLLLAVAVLSAVAVTALVLAGRANSNSMLNAQGWFGLSVTLLLFLNAKSKPEIPVAVLHRRDVWCALALALVVVAAWWRALYVGFLSDDFILLQRALHEPLWLSALFTQGGGDGFFRPLGNLSYWLTAAGWAGGEAWRWHVNGVAIHALDTALFYLLARSFGLARFAAVFAGLLFAIHGSRPEAVAWTAARFDLLMMLFVLCGLALYQSANRLCVALSFLCMIAALLTKEASYAFPLLLLLFGPVRKALPFWLGALAMFVYRWMLVGGIGGYKSAGGENSAAMHFGLLSIAKVLALRLWSILYLPVNRALEQSPILTLLAALFMGVMVVAAGASANRRKLTRALLFLLAASLPPMTQLLIGLDLEKSRVLYLPAAGFCLLLGVLLEAQSNLMKWAFCAALLAFQFAAMQHNLNGWLDASQTTEQAVTSAVACLGSNNEFHIGALPRTLHGVYFFANGFPEALSMRLGRPVRQSNAPSAIAMTWDAARREIRCGE